MARLTDNQVQEMRAAYAAGGVTHQQLADRYGVSRVHVSRIMCGMSRFSDGQTPNGPTRCSNAKLTSEQVVRIRKMYRAGSARQTELANMFGVTQPQISLIVRGKSRVDG